jgi:hypothetical protein
MSDLPLDEIQRIMLEKLRTPFPPDQIHKLPKPTKKDATKGKCNECGGWHGLPAVHLDYVGHAERTARLLDVDPWWNWEPAGWTEHGTPRIDVRGGTATMWIKLNVAGVTRLGVGSCSANKDDVEKELIGDALRNAAMRFGAALDLWSKSERHTAASEQPKQRTASKPKAQPARAAEADPATGEIPEPPNVQDVIGQLNQEGRKELQAKMDKANFPGVGELGPAAARQVIKWAQEIQEAHEKGAPFA